LQNGAATPIPDGNYQHPDNCGGHKPADRPPNRRLPTDKLPSYGSDRRVSMPTAACNLGRTLTAIIRRN